MNKEAKDKAKDQPTATATPSTNDLSFVLMVVALILMSGAVMVMSGAFLVHVAKS